MGTSKAYGGPSNGLVPSFVDTPPAPTSPRPQPQVAPGSAPAQPASAPNTGAAGSFRGARANFTRFARTSSRSSLGKAMSSYVRGGNGGARRASRRMGSSQAAARGLLGIVRDIQSQGAAQTLRQLNLGGLAGQPAADVFVSLVEFLCPPGGSVDEGIARHAMMETITDMAEAGLGSFDTLGREQLNDMFLNFIAHSIEGRVIADLGHRGVQVSNDIAAVEHMQDELHDFISGATRGQLAGRLEGIVSLSDRDIEQRVNQIYEAAFNLIAIAGEDVE
ncbi:Qat anti-phage system associated protein QatB [Serratia marcescens]|uniref:Qat anti-phage system associated protein QatB n=1 Tax=Serratia TaxID=613 RepID=UPI0031FDA075